MSDDKHWEQMTDVSQVYVAWDFSGCDTAAEAQKKMDSVCQVALGSIKVPATIVDQSGNILVWYLPRVLSKSLQVSLMAICRGMTHTIFALLP